MSTSEQASYLHLKMCSCIHVIPAAFYSPFWIVAKKIQHSWPQLQEAFWFSRK